MKKRIMMAVAAALMLATGGQANPITTVGNNGYSVTRMLLLKL
jgi:hypothetical protein